MAKKKLKGYIVSDEMAPGEDFEASTKPMMENPNSVMTAYESSGDDGLIPKNPYGPDGMPGGKK